MLGRYDAGALEPSPFGLALPPLILLDELRKEGIGQDRIFVLGVEEQNCAIANCWITPLRRSCGRPWSAQKGIPRAGLHPQ